MSVNLITVVLRVNFDTYQVDIALLLWQTAKAGGASVRTITDIGVCNTSCEIKLMINATPVAALY